jgi:CheY-like chemotaxis protein
MRAIGRDAQLSLLIVHGHEPSRRAIESAAEDIDRFWSLRSFADGRFAIEHIWECIEHSRKLIPDIVVLDRRLAGLTGVQVTRELRRYDETRSIFIAFISSTHEPAGQDEAENAGCDFFIPLPESPEALGVILNSIANRCVARATGPARMLC